MTPPPALRLDVWLWRARFFRTRALAAAHVREAGVRLSAAGQTRRVMKPGLPVAVGDVVTFADGGHIVCVEVSDLGARRGPASEARALYRPVEAS